MAANDPQVPPGHATEPSPLDDSPQNWQMHAFGQLAERITGIDGKLDRLDDRLGGKLDRLDDRLRSTDGKVNRILGGIAVLAAAVILVGAVAGIVSALN